MIQYIIMERLFGENYVMTPTQAKMLNPSSLAFVGDAVYTLYIRGLVTAKSDTLSGKLHTITTSYVRASGQSNLTQKILPILSEDEMDIYKRARNYDTHSVSKNADIIDYKRATGFEALIGYLYLTNNIKRLNELLDMTWRKE